MIKVDQFNKGWNIFTNRENARKLISKGTYLSLMHIKGKKYENFWIKFYFSIKNNEQSNQNHSRGGYNNYRTSNSNSNFNEFHEKNDRKVKYIPKSPNSKTELINIKELKEP